MGMTMCTCPGKMISHVNTHKGTAQGLYAIVSETDCKYYGCDYTIGPIMCVHSVALCNSV